VFRRIVNFIQEVRMKADFLKYEEKCCFEHIRMADLQFSTQQLQKEVWSFISQIQEEADCLFEKKSLKYALN
jgi:hypothetical protein